MSHPTRLCFGGILPRLELSDAASYEASLIAWVPLWHQLWVLDEMNLEVDWLGVLDDDND